jgi:hypothetical protein
VVQAPVAPTGLVAIPGNAQVGLTWSATSNATSYDLKRATSSSGPYGQLGTAATPSYMDTTAVNGTTYFYVVAAVNSQGTSVDSAPASGTPAAVTTTPPVSTPPVTPPPVTPPPVTPPPVTTPPVTTTPVTSLPAVAVLNNVQAVINGSGATITAFMNCHPTATSSSLPMARS